MSNPWKKVSAPANTQDLSEIMSEEYAKGLQVKEDIKFAEEISDNIFNQDILSDTIDTDVSATVLEKIDEVNLYGCCDSDAIIAKVLQCQFDKEHDNQVKLVQKKLNGDSKVSVSYDNYRYVPEHLLYDSESDDDDIEVAHKKDWDRFETNEKEIANLPKRGYIVKNGEIVTKHDSILNGRRNACRVMAFPPEVCTGDGAGFDMKLPNSVFNELKEHSRLSQARKIKLYDRKSNQATTEMGIDEATRLILFKFIANINLLEHVNGVISTGKESVVLHAKADQTYPDLDLPAEVAIKIFKTTLNEFKSRDKYIEADYRFKDRFSKQNPRKIVHMWAEKEMHNMLRIKKVGINCPEMICLRKHVLVMSFIGKDNKPAHKLKDVTLSPNKWENVYKEVIDIMHKLYNVGRLVHADLSEYNILWWEDRCWLIDVSQSVQPDHPHALEFLFRDCRNIIRFFEKKLPQDIMSPEDLFKSITGFDEVDINMLEGVHTTYNSLSSRFEIAPDDNRNIKYPFEYCWDNEKQRRDTIENVDECNEVWQFAGIVDDAGNFANEVKIVDDPVDKAGNSNPTNVTDKDISQARIDKKS